MVGYVIAVICIVLLLLIILFFTLNLKIWLKYSTVSGKFNADLSVLFVRVPLYPSNSKTNKKIKTKKKKKTSSGIARRKIKDNLDTVSQKGKAASENSEGGSPGQKAGQIVELIKHLCISLRELAPGILDASTLEIKQLDICVGAEDAADAAINYGIICGGAEMLMAFEHDCKKLIVSESPDISVDFLSPKSKAQLEMVLTVRAYKALLALYRAEDAYYTYQAGL